MVDAFASLSVVDLKVQDDLTVTDDLIVNGDIDLEGSIDVNGTANLDVVDIDGAVDMASTLTVAGVVDITDTTDSSDATGDTGALRTEGGASIAKKLFTGDGITTSTAAGDNNFPLTAYHPTGTAARTIARFQSNVGSTGATVASITAGGKITATELDVSGSIDVDAVTHLDVVDIDGAVDMAESLTLAGNADFNGNLDVSGTSNLDVVDIDGAVDMATTLSVTGNVTLGGQLIMPDVTSTKMLVADGTSYQEVSISGDVTIANTGAVTIAANAVEGSMLNNDVISGQTALTSGLVTDDELLVSDGGTLKRMDVSVLTTLTDDNATALAIALG